MRVLQVFQHSCLNPVLPGRSALSYSAVMWVGSSFTASDLWPGPPEDRPLVLGSLWSFFHFILRFWNQILICLSDRHSVCAISMRRLRVRYLLKWNSFSSSKACCRVYAVRDRLGSGPVWFGFTEMKQHTVVTTQQQSPSLFLVPKYNLRLKI